MNAQVRPDPRIRWPAGLAPAACPVFAHNEIEAAVAPHDVWSWLVEARRWHTFYTNCKRLRIRNDGGGGDRLGAGTRFTWWTFGVPVDTTVDAFEEGRYLAWSGRGLGARGHHVWLVEPTDEGCRIVTEETQAGAVVRVLAPLLRTGLQHYHQRWLEGLVRVAAGGPPA